MTIPWPPAAQTAHNPQAVARILKTLPEWFGREESNAEYIHDEYDGMELSDARLSLYVFPRQRARAS